jgi:hypothetical protein
VEGLGRLRDEARGLARGTEVQSVSTWRSLASLRLTSPCCPRALPVSARRAICCTPSWRWRADGSARSSPAPTGSKMKPRRWLIMRQVYHELAHGDGLLVADARTAQRRIENVAAHMGIQLTEHETAAARQVSGELHRAEDRRGTSGRPAVLVQPGLSRLAAASETARALDELCRSTRQTAAKTFSRNPVSSCSARTFPAATNIKFGLTARNRGCPFTRVGAARIVPSSNRLHRGRFFHGSTHDERPVHAQGQPWSCDDYQGAGVTGDREPARHTVRDGAAGDQHHRAGRLRLHAARSWQCHRATRCHPQGLYRLATMMIRRLL